MTEIRAYRNGEETEYTGVTFEKYGATWYEFVVVADSHRVGWKGVTMEAPKLMAEQYEAQRSEQDSDERALLTHVSRWGSDGYPVQKVGSHHWAWNFRSLHSGRVYPTKREATLSFERYMESVRGRARDRR